MTTTGSLMFALFCGLVVVISGYHSEETRIKRDVNPTDLECMKPPMKRLAHQCCRLPRERIWGDLRSSLNTCIRRLKHDRRVVHTEMAYEDTPAGMVTPRGNPHRKMHHHHHPHHPDDSCFMECVFEDQGFITGQMVDKTALLERLNQTLGRNEVWHNVATAAVETCHQNEMNVPANSSCQSGSEEIFRCVFKHIFFNCPNWPVRNEYCSDLRAFYQRCPNGPPPEVNDNHSTTQAPAVNDNQSTPAPEVNDNQSTPAPEEGEQEAEEEEEETQTNTSTQSPQE